MLAKNNWIIVTLVIFVSLWFSKFWQMPWWINLLMGGLWLGVVKVKPKYSWIFLILLIVLNLNLNRLFYFKISPLAVSFDKEQSFLGYPGIRESIAKDKLEGLWAPYQLRNFFYSSYLIFFSYLTGVAKLLSPLFWVRIIGFSGTLLFSLGIISYFKKGLKKYYLWWWFLVVVLTSALRVLGDSVTAIYLTLPVVIILMFWGSKTDFFKKYQFYWWLLFLFDLLIK